MRRLSKIAVTLTVSVRLIPDQLDHPNHDKTRDSIYIICYYVSDKTFQCVLLSPG